MTQEDKEFLDRITAYSEEVMKDVNPDPQVTPISEQLAYLRPIMEEISKETNTPVEDVFIRYMDLASLAAVDKKKEFDEDFVDFTDMKDARF